MKFSAQGDALKQAISIVEKAVSSRTTLPVMENIYFELNSNQLKLRGNDLEMGIEYSFPVEHTESLGSVLIKAKTIASIASKMSQNQVIHFQSDSASKVTLHLDKVDFEILGTPTQEYPIFPSVEQGVQFSLAASELKSMIRDTIFSVSFEETKQFLNGILFKREENSLLMVSTDGYRLSLRRTPISASQEPFQVIIPHKAANELLKILQSVNDDTQVQVNVSATQVSFRMPHFLLLSRVIQGQFPDYNQVLPKVSNNMFSVGRRQLLLACERASIIASSSNNVVRLYFDQFLTIKANAAGMGGFKEELMIDRKRGEDQMKVAFNVKLIMDAIRNMESDDIEIEFNNELSPCIMKPAGQDSYTYIIMPIRMSDFEQREAEPVPAPAVAVNDSNALG